MEITYVYQQSEPRLFTVGYYNPTGKWMPESDHDSSEAAAARVHYLNGGSDNKLREYLAAIMGECENGLRNSKELTIVICALNTISHQAQAALGGR